MSQYSVTDLKAKYKTLVAAKEAFQVKASSWDALVKKLNQGSDENKTWQDEVDELEAQAGIFLAGNKEAIKKVRGDKGVAPLFKKIDIEPQPKQIDLRVRDEILRLSKLNTIDSSVLETFALFVLNPPPPPEPLTLAELKDAVYKNFGVKDTTSLKKSGSFKMATDGMDKLNLSVKDGWEKLYRKFIGILPNETNQQGYGCINGINIFNYFKPWQVFNLEPKTATGKDIKDAYNALVKVYHPDVQKTGDATIFDRIVTMYKSISAEA